MCIQNKIKEVIAMNMNTLYIMLGFIFVYAMISNARDKIKKRDEKSKEAFERLQTSAYKKELEKVINLSQNDAFNIAALRKAYFLNGKDAKKLIEIFKKNRQENKKLNESIFMDRIVEFLLLIN